LKNQHNVAKGVISNTSSSQASVPLTALRSHAKAPRPKEAVERSKDQDNPLYMAHHNLQLGNNNDTRWNLTFYMIERALRLREPLQLWIGANSMENEDRRLPTEKRLTSDDWEVSQAIVDLLRHS
jgi:hypothetical protein